MATVLEHAPAVEAPVRQSEWVGWAARIVGHTPTGGVRGSRGGFLCWPLRVLPTVGSHRLTDMERSLAMMIVRSFGIPQSVPAVFRVLGNCPVFGAGIRWTISAMRELYRTAPERSQCAAGPPATTPTLRRYTSARRFQIGQSERASTARAGKSGVEPEPAARNRVLFSFLITPSDTNRRSQPSAWFFCTSNAAATSATSLGSSR